MLRRAPLPRSPICNGWVPPTPDVHPRNTWIAASSCSPRPTRSRVSCAHNVTCTSGSPPRLLSVFRLGPSYRASLPPSSPPCSLLPSCSGFSPRTYTVPARAAPSKQNYPPCPLTPLSSPLPGLELRAPWPLGFSKKRDLGDLGPLTHTPSGPAALRRDPCFPSHRPANIPRLHAIHALTFNHSKHISLPENLSFALPSAECLPFATCLPGQLLLLPNKLVQVSPPGWSIPASQELGHRLRIMLANAWAYPITKLFTSYPSTWHLGIIPHLLNEPILWSSGQVLKYHEMLGRNWIKHIHLFSKERTLENHFMYW